MFNYYLIAHKYIFTYYVWTVLLKNKLIINTTNRKTIMLGKKGASLRSDFFVFAQKNCHPILINLLIRTKFKKKLI